jgi:hypothetical protein
LFFFFVFVFFVFVFLFLFFWLNTDLISRMINYKTFQFLFIIFFGLRTRFFQIYYLKKNTTSQSVVACNFTV